MSLSFGDGQNENQAFYFRLREIDGNRLQLETNTHINLQKEMSVCGSPLVELVLPISILTLLDICQPDISSGQPLCSFASRSLT